MVVTGECRTTQRKGETANFRWKMPNRELQYLNGLTWDPQNAIYKEMTNCTKSKSSMSKCTDIHQYIVWIYLYYSIVIVQKQNQRSIIKAGSNIHIFNLFTVYCAWSTLAENPQKKFTKIWENWRLPKIRESFVDSEKCLNMTKKNNIVSDHKGRLKGCKY